MYGMDIVSDALFAIDKTTGNDALIGSIGFNANYAQDMAFDLSTGILYLAGFDGDAFTDYMYTVDTTTGTREPDRLRSVRAFGEVDAMGIETAGGPCASAAGSAVAVAEPAHGHDGAGRLVAGHGVDRRYRYGLTATCFPARCARPATIRTTTTWRHRSRSRSVGVAAEPSSTAA